jgi:hypothetical protein
MPRLTGASSTLPAIEARNESGLLAKYQRQVLNSRTHLQGGLVQHAFIAGQLADLEVAERLAGVTTRKLFLHSVHDPVRLVISDFNHELIARHCGGIQCDEGIFEPFGLSSDRGHRRSHARSISIQIRERDIPRGAGLGHPQSLDLKSLN